MVFGASLVAVVGCFVVVPDGDQRGVLPQILQIDVGVVLGVTLAVIIQADDLASGQEASIVGTALCR